MTNLAFLSLGSNIDAEINLPAAVDLLSDFGALKGVSNVWETHPVGYRSQPNFLNAAVILETELSANAFLRHAVRKIEKSLNRVRTSNKNGPRTIDIDIALFNREVLSIKHRRIPDPEIFERAFVAIPLAELAPHYRHPETGQTLAEIAGQFDIQNSRMVRRDDVKLASYYPGSKPY